MAHQLSGHLRNAAILAVAAAVALTTERLAAVPSPAAGGASRANPSDIVKYMTPVGMEMLPLSFRTNVGIDPFQGSLDPSPPDPATTTTPASLARPARRLTAILVADDRRIAVIDDAAVGVGDVLRDGAKVSSIQADRVWLVHRNGQSRVLTLTSRGQ